MSEDIKNTVYISFTIILLTISLCLTENSALAEEILNFDAYTTEDQAPSPPRNLRIIASDGTYYKSTIDKLKNQDPQVRKKACDDLYFHGKNLKDFVHELAREINNKDVIVLSLIHI